MVQYLTTRSRHGKGWPRQTMRPSISEGKTECQWPVQAQEYFTSWAGASDSRKGILSAHRLRTLRHLRRRWRRRRWREGVERHECSSWRAGVASPDGRPYAAYTWETYMLSASKRP